MVFGRDGHLYMAIGERQEQDRAQDPLDHGGKVIRLRDDGSVPEDNPFVGIDGYMPEIYSLGHRSPHGLAVHPETGEIWANEHGPLGGLTAERSRANSPPRVGSPASSIPSISARCMRRNLETMRRRRWLPAA
jgi:glucose/arabinose dehydrogenase